MNTFQIEFQPSVAAKEAAVKQGRVLPREITIIVDPADLTAEERELILKIGTPYTGSTLKMSGYENPDGEDLSAVFQYLRAKAEKERVAKDEAEERKRQEAQKRIEDAKVYVAGGEPRSIAPYNPKTGDAELDAAVLAEYNRREAEKQAKAEAEKQAKAEAVETLRTWALENGSEHLKDLISEGFNWQEVARKEWIAAHTPEGFVNVGDDPKFDTWYKIKNPTANAIAVLRETRKTNPDAMLMRVKFDDGMHEDWVSIDLFPPAGESVSREKFIENYNEE